MSETTNKPPIWYWIVTVILLLWGLMGIWVFYDFISSTPQSMAKYVTDGAISQAYADHLMSIPAWATAVFAVAVFTGGLGALCLLMRRTWSVSLYMLSLLFIVISHINTFVMAKAHKLMGGGQIGMEMLVLVFGLFALWFAVTAKRKSWLS